MLLLAAVLDGLDGGMARLLKATSDFGAQLDSLFDILSFGVAPETIRLTNLVPPARPARAPRAAACA